MPPPLKAKKEATAASGAVILAAPIEGMALVKGATFDVGSDNKEQRWAIDLCRLDPLGSACKLDQFFAKGRIDNAESRPLSVEPRISLAVDLESVASFGRY